MQNILADLGKTQHSLLEKKNSFEGFFQNVHLRIEKCTINLLIQYIFTGRIKLYSLLTTKKCFC